MQFLMKSKEDMDDSIDNLMKQIGAAVARLHDGGLVHGDLTTSNMMIRDSDEQLVLLDFGLSYFSKLPEDKGVDLYVMERALISTHSDQPDLFKSILEAYRAGSKHHVDVFRRFAEVRIRGRKRTMVG
jgi:TP53 regulating kinase and related kinases